MDSEKKTIVFESSEVYYAYFRTTGLYRTYVALSRKYVLSVFVTSHNSIVRFTMIV